jgi:small subunit ribosomal protein S14
MARKALIEKQLKLETARKQALENKSSKFHIAKHYNRCKLCGRTHAYIREFDICRVCFRKYARE